MSESPFAPEGLRQATTAPALIIGLGASAGGIEALERFFRHMPSDSGAAFVVVQHLSPDFRSLMDELLDISCLSHGKICLRKELLDLRPHWRMPWRGYVLWQSSSG